MRYEQFNLKALGAWTVFIGSIVFVAFAFRHPANNFNTQIPKGTWTALALSGQVLYDRFPTATGPTPAATNKAPAL